ncbi:hypothetical protein TCAL_06845 [Tigriopus californicus]|uniref:K Homology domain-containing protein n=1 Tax=Tigriopus californicus TaxID=6832 RepID=A0A553NSS8_TIGCA|nr:poly(rC)-binding protein 3-like [Tigriopus californicus]TRY68469.1 hypothetical protein TCAL_06845 [Tigriopus californicus]|eukprot:TCALIF_06845-PA protein Name:"Similar to PCBP3 Poly(rC)-binding protein 3 (Homo sapiens)" AED:0.00 eAED:0.02 QI:0/-1/0/1/-1/1/1/0/455
MSDIDKPNPSEATSATLTLRMIMSGKEVGSIIGKGGEIINNIREDSGAKIHISDGSVPERIVTVTGTTDAILKAFSLICKKFEEDGGTRESPISSSSSSSSSSTTPKQTGVTLRLVVPASQCGSLIGKGGSKIKDIRETSGASIQVASDMLPNSTERAVTISGAKDAISQCIFHVCSVMLESPPKGTPIPYTPKGGGLLGASNSRSGRGGSVENPLASLLSLGGGASTLAALATLAGSQIRDRRDSNSRSTGDHERGGSQYDMSIPNDLIGCIIGKGGSKIAEIRQISGAMIRISKSDEGGEEKQSERQITITGNSDSVALARSLINMSLDIHKSKGDERDGGRDRDSRDRSERDRGDRYNSSNSSVNMGLAQLLSKPETLTSALTTLASFSSIGGLGVLGGLGGNSSGGLGGSGNFGQVSGAHRSRGSYGSSSRGSRDDDRGSRDSKRSKFAPY